VSSRIAFVGVMLGALVACVTGCTVVQDLGGSETTKPAAPVATTTLNANTTPTGFGTELGHPLAGRTHMCPLSAPTDGDECTTENTAPCTYPATTIKNAGRASFHVCGVNKKWVHFEDTLLAFDGRSCARGAACTTSGIRCNKPCVGLNTVKGCVETCTCNGTTFECNAP